MRLLLLLLLLAPLAAAQAHDHGASGIAIVSDLNADHIAHVGTPAQFTLIAFGDDRVPDFHQDLPVRVLWGETVIWETTDISGHDYDGVNSFFVTFPAAGPFSVQALMGGKAVAWYNGTAVEAEPLDVELNVDMGQFLTTSTLGGSYQTVRYNITSGADRLEHVDVWLEVWWQDQLVLRTHTHTHDEDQEVWMRFPSPGTYTLRLLGFQAYPTAQGAAFAPVLHESTIEVPTSPAVPSPLAATAQPPAEANAIVLGQGGQQYELVGTYDPFTRVGPGTLQHLSALVIDPATGHTVQHVDFEARLVGPRGDVFRSATLHEYDGIYDLATMQHDLGLYTLHVTATRGDWTGTLEMPYAVLPPVLATLAGPQTVQVAAQDIAAGETGDAMLSVRDAAGRAFAHGEIATQVLGRNGVPLIQAKLHTHGGGDFPFRLAMPDAGEHPLRLSPFPLEAQPVTTYDLSGARSIHVVQGPGFHVLAPPAEPPAEKAAPAPPAALALAGALLHRVRRHRFDGASASPRR